jgi:hypothetical protein
MIEQRIMESRSELNSVLTCFSEARSLSVSTRLSPPHTHVLKLFLFFMCAVGILPKDSPHDLEEKVPSPQERGRADFPMRRVRCPSFTQNFTVESIHKAYQHWLN